MIPFLGAILAIASANVVPVPTVLVQAQRQLDVFQHEPSVRQIQRAAIAYAGLHPRILHGLRTRARLAAAVPDLRFRIARIRDDRGRAATAFDDGGSPHEVSATETREDQLRLEGELRWYPSKVVFRQEETKLVRENRHAAHDRQQLLEAVTRVYFDRRRTQVRLATAKEIDEATRVQMMIDLRQLTGELDGLTGGTFSRLLTAARRP
jgi:hypothetical protein